MVLLGGPLDEPREELRLDGGEPEVWTILLHRAQGGSRDGSPLLGRTLLGRTLLGGLSWGGLSWGIILVNVCSKLAQNSKM